MQGVPPLVASSTPVALTGKDSLVSLLDSILLLESSSLLDGLFAYSTQHNSPTVMCVWPALRQPSCLHLPRRLVPSTPIVSNRLNGKKTMEKSEKRYLRWHVRAVAHLPTVCKILPFCVADSLQPVRAIASLPTTEHKHHDS